MATYTTDAGTQVQVVDISEWTEAERSDIRAEYAVVGAPYGESIPTQWHGTEAHAERALWETQGIVRGTSYDTSWGTQDADYDSLRIVRYVALAQDAETGSVVIEAHPYYLDAEAPAGEDSELSTPTHSVTAFGRTVYAPRATPLANMFGTERVQELTAPVSASIPRENEDAMQASIESVLHNSIQEASELHAVRMTDGYARPYLSTDAPYARKGL